MIASLLLWVLGTMASATPTVAAGDLALLGATLHLGDGRVVEDGALVIREGKIAAVGPRSEVEVPAGVEAVEVSGLHATPGLVEARGELLIEERALSGVGSPESWSVVDAIDPFEPGADLVRSEGVTTVGLVIGRAPISGPAAILKLRRPDLAQECGGLVLERESHLVLTLATLGPVSTSAARLEAYTRLRSALVDAREYERQWDGYRKAYAQYSEAAAKFDAEREKKAGDAETPGAADEEEKKEKLEPEKPKAPEEKKDDGKKEPPKPPRAPGVDLVKEALVRALRSELPVLIEAYRPDEIGYALRLIDEFALDATLLGAVRAGEAAPALARKPTPVALSPVWALERALEYRGHSESTARDLAAAGVPVAIASGGSSPEEVSALRSHAIVAVRGGLDPEAALRAITLAPAEALGVEARVGSLEVGKDGDVVLFDGPPLDVRSRVVRAIVEGDAFGAFDGALRPVDRRSPRPASGAPSGAALGDRGPKALRGGRVVLPSEDGRGARVVEGLEILLRDGRIERISAEPTAQDATVVELRGAWVLPGWIDAHSHAGLAGDVDDISSAINEPLRVLDGFDPWDDEVVALLRRGVTTAALAPGGANVVGGEIALVKLVPGRAPLRVVSRHVAWKASLTPAFGLPRYPTAPSGAVEALTSWVRGLRDREDARALPILTQFSTLASAQLTESVARESGARMVFLEGVGTDAETFRRLDTREPVVLGPYTTAEPSRVTRAAGLLAKAGRPFALAGSGTAADPLSTALLCVRAGLDEDTALASLTTVPARLYGVADRLGAVVEGADADLTVWSADPFSGRGQLLQAYIDGELVLDGDQVVGTRVEPPREVTSASASPVSSPREAQRERGEASSVTRGPAGAEGREWVLRARRLHTVAAGTIEGGHVRVRGARIVAVGESLDAVEGAGLPVLEVDGDVIPGLVDAGSDLCLSSRRVDEFNELTPALEALGGIDLDRPARRRALSGGVTTAAVSPGDRNVIGGLGGVVKTHEDGLRAATLRRDAFLAVALTEAASAQNRSMRSGRPVSYYYRIPTTRMGTIFLARRALLEARTDGWPDAGPESGLRPMLTADERALLRATLDGARPLRLRAETAAEIRTALRIGAEFGTTVHVEGAREGLELVDELAAARAAVLLPVDDSWSGEELEIHPGLGASLPARLAEAGVPFAFIADREEVLPSLRERVLWAVRQGLDPSRALEAITLAPARLLGVEERVGSIAAGRDADLVVLSGEPWALTSSVLWVLAAGEVVPVASSVEIPGDAPRRSRTVLVGREADAKHLETPRATRGF